MIETPAPGANAQDAREVIHDEGAEDRRAQRSMVLARATKFVSYFFGILYALITLEFLLEMFAARDGNAFKQFLDSLTAPFLAPFRTLLPTLAAGNSQIIFSYVVAFAVYLMVHMGVLALARIIARPGEEL